MASAAASGPVELRRVDRRQLHDRDADARAVVAKLGAQRIAEAADGVFRPAIGRLQRDAAIGERRAHLHDDAAAARAHRAQRRHGPVHEPQIGDLGDPPELVRAHLPHRREHRGHGVVHPHVDGSERLLDLRRRREQLVGVGNVGRGAEGRGAQFLDLAPHVLEGLRVAGDQAELGAGAGEPVRGGAADAGRRPGDHHHLVLQPHLRLPRRPGAAARGEAETRGERRAFR